MAVRTTVFKALTFSILVEEFHDRDAAGHLNAYLASIYVETAAGRHLVRRSRLPGAAESLRQEVERDGIRAFRRLASI
ncbi:hypothetical protein [Ensifer adhaerens]|uniref:hypothetical protein n=1 Tax=Ensifer adhaerens TaxID=106592 RepID=UPI001C4E2644|nr:hypothetical protein [Ensifer adhaerens]MBW0369986.1 hypothetical protein [Ensifer adhaerens]UCM19059.1 hypothetical protein LDL63_14595 [Ensifer adhaerens]